MISLRKKQKEASLVQIRKKLYNESSIDNFVQIFTETYLVELSMEQQMKVTMKAIRPISMPDHISDHTKRLIRADKEVLKIRDIYKQNNYLPIERN